MRDIVAGEFFPLLEGTRPAGLDDLEHPLVAKPPLFGKAHDLLDGFIDGVRPREAGLFPNLFEKGVDHVLRQLRQLYAGQRRGAQMAVEQATGFVRKCLCAFDVVSFEP